MTESIGEEDFLRWVIFYHERQEALVRGCFCMPCFMLCLVAGLVSLSGPQLSENSANRGHALDSFTVLADLQGASVRHLAPAVISIAQKRTKLEEAHYPEVAKR
jgi:high-affinity Fe2+/Pb2+ permease